MKDNPVAWLNCLIDRCRIHFVEGTDLRVPETGIEWQGRADQLLQEARAGVKERSPDDAWRLETLSPYPPVGLLPGHPWWTPWTPTPVLGTDSCTSSALCEENHPVSYHLALINCLKEIVSDWRAKPPGRKTGPKPINLDKQMSTAKHLLNTDKATSKSDAAKLAVEEHGRGGCASDAAAIDKVRKDM